MSLKLENETLQIQAIERGKIINRLMAISNNNEKHQNHNLQIQTNNRLVLLEETIEDWNEAENDDQEEIYPNNNILITQKKQQHHRPEFSITKIYILCFSETRRFQNL